VRAASRSYKEDKMNSLLRQDEFSVAACHPVNVYGRCHSSWSAWLKKASLLVCPRPVGKWDSSSYIRGRVHQSKTSDKLSNISLPLLYYYSSSPTFPSSSVPDSPFLLYSNLPSLETLYSDYFELSYLLVNPAGLLTIGTRAVDSRFLPWIPLP
jgi:hypothetical protein